MGGLSGSGIGFLSGGTKSAASDMQQYTVGAGGNNPINGTSTFSPNPALYGTTMMMSVSGFGYLEAGVQFTWVTSGGRITDIELLGGLLFNTNEVYTVFSGY